MKALTAAAAAILLGVSTLPALVLGGDAPDLETCGRVVDGGQLGVILATIRTVETGGRYDTRITTSTASGAYAFIDSSWRHYGELAGVDVATYTSAWMAPPADQDATATAYVNQILADHQGRIEIIPVAWYLPSAIDNPAKMDVVPPVGGNRLTPRQYQAKWMNQYRLELQRAGLDDAPATLDPATTTTVADNTPTTTSQTQPLSPGGCVGGSITPLAGDWSLPGPRAVIDANTAALDDPHHDYPAWDWMIPIDTPIYAIRSGRVANVRTWPHNWWTQGCTAAGVNGCDTCGVGVTIIDAAGYHWTYCHGTNLTVHLEDQVTAGQQILWSGNSGRSGAPHVHVEIRTNGTRRCPQPLVQSLNYHGVGIDPATLPTTGCSF
jgi:murein DD-endopeptidase MepM/ murein hydrolase activator NlpD